MHNDKTGSMRKEVFYSVDQANLKCNSNCNSSRQFRDMVDFNKSINSSNHV